MFSSLSINLISNLKKDKYMKELLGAVAIHILFAAIIILLILKVS